MEDNYNNITAKAYKTFGLVRHTLSHTIDIEIKITLCLTLVRSQLLPYDMYTFTKFVKSLESSAR